MFTKVLILSVNIPKVYAGELTFH